MTGIVARMARLTIYDRRERALVAAADALLCAGRAAARLPARARRAAGTHPLLPARADRRSADDRCRRSPSCARWRPARRSTSWSAAGTARSRRRSRASIGSRRVDAEWLIAPGDRRRVDAAGRLGAQRPRAGARGATISRSTSSPTSARTSRWPPRARGARRDSRAAAADRCSTSRSTTTRRRTPPTTRVTLVRAAFGASAERRSPWAPSHPGGRIARRRRGCWRRSAGALKVGIHVSGGRAIKQWPETRFREVAEYLVRDRSAAIVLTGTPADRAQIEVVRAALPPDRVLDLSDSVDLLTAARGDRAARPVRDRRHGPDAPGATPSARRSSRCSGRRIRAATRRAA